MQARRFSSRLFAVKGLAGIGCCETVRQTRMVANTTTGVRIRKNIVPALGGKVIYDQGWQVADLRALRRDQIGFVFQAPYLIPFLDIIDNVALLPMLAGISNEEARAKALELLTALDVQHRARALPSQLSGGGATTGGHSSRLGQSPSRYSGR